METLLREEEDQRKCLRLPIGTGSDLEQIPSGQPAQSQKQEEVETTQSPLNISMEAITDGDSSELFLLKDLKPPTRVNPKRTQDPSAHKSTDIKQGKLRKVDLEPATDQASPLLTVKPKTVHSSAEKLMSPSITLLDGQEETDDRQREKTNQNDEIRQKSISP